MPSAALVAIPLHLCLVGYGLMRVCGVAETSKAVQHAVSHSATGPALLLASFLLVDRCIAMLPTGTDADCPMDESDSIPLITIAVFSTLMVSNILSTCAAGTRDLNFFFAITVHAMIVVAYVQLHFGVGSGAVVWRTSYGSWFYPGRINLWMHSSMSQIYGFAASPSAVERYGASEILRRVRDTFLMFVFGFLATAPAPAVLPTEGAYGYTIGLLFLSAPLLVRIVTFMAAALPICLHVPQSAEASEVNRLFMRALTPLMLSTWVAFPLIWCAAALKLITPQQEAAIFSATDLLAKVGATPPWD